ncbi:MAG TPA: hypothetical protein VGF04_02490 [Solirubrobacterales bacterium]|jgi:hypothetical protein
MQATEASPSRAWSRRPATALLLAAMAVSAALIVVLGSRLTFLLDDWTYIINRRGFNADAFLLPANEHFVAGPVAIWKSLIAVFGISSMLPYKLVSTAIFLLGAWFTFVWIRRRIGEWPALFATVPLLFMGAAFDDYLWFASITFLGSLTCGLGMLLALDRRDEGGDLRACLWLVGSMLFSGLWLAFAAGAAVDIALRRRERDWRGRAYLVAVPVILWAIWWLGWGHQAEGSFKLENLGTTPLFVLDSFAAALAALLGLGTPAPGIAAPGGLDWGRPLAVLVGALAIWRAYRLPRIPRSFWVVLAVGLTFWVLGGVLVKEGRVPWASRYQLPGATLVLLAATELLRGVRLDRRLLAPAIVAVVAVSASGILFLDLSYRSYRHTSELERADLAALELSRDRVDPGLVLSEDIADTGYVGVLAGPYLSARDAYGSPAFSESELAAAPEDARVAADKVLARAVGATLGPTTAPGEASCRTIAASKPGTVVSLEPGSTALRAGGGSTVRVLIGRFSDSFPVIAGTLDPEAWEELRIPTDRSARPWRMELTGAGRVAVCHPGV